MQITTETTMGEILAAYPSARIGLFQRFHIGGCRACGYETTQTLAEVCRVHEVRASLDEIIACIEASAASEAALHVSVADIHRARAAGREIVFVDVRSRDEFERGHIEGARWLSVELTFEILDAWPKDTALVLYSNHGKRSLERAAYFRAYGLDEPRSLDGGLSEWTSPR